MFCKRRHYKNPTRFGHHYMTIFRGRPSFLVHSPLFCCLLRHLSFLGLWPYALYLYVCPVYLSVCCLVVQNTTRQHTDGYLNVQSGYQSKHN
jgi:hypothetical protein